MIPKICFAMYKMLCFIAFGIVFVLTILSLNGIIIENIPYLGILRGVALSAITAIMCVTSFIGCSGLTKSNYTCILISTLLSSKEITSTMLKAMFPSIDEDNILIYVNLINICTDPESSRPTLEQLSKNLEYM